RSHRQGDCQAGRFRWDYQGRRAAWSALPGEPGFQQRRTYLVRVKSGIGPAVVWPRAGGRLTMDRQGQALHNLQNQGEYTAAFPRLTFVHQSPASSATEDAGLKPHDLSDLMGWPTSIPSRQCSAGMTVQTENPMTMHLI